MMIHLFYHPRIHTRLFAHAMSTSLSDVRSPHTPPLSDHVRNDTTSNSQSVGMPDVPDASTTFEFTAVESPIAEPLTSVLSPPPTIPVSTAMYAATQSSNSSQSEHMGTSSSS